MIIAINFSKIKLIKNRYMELHMQRKLRHRRNETYIQMKECNNFFSFKKEYLYLEYIAHMAAF